MKQKVNTVLPLLFFHEKKKACWTESGDGRKYKIRHLKNKKKKKWRLLAEARQSR